MVITCPVLQIQYIYIDLHIILDEYEDDDKDDESDDDDSDDGHPDDALIIYVKLKSVLEKKARKRD